MRTAASTLLRTLLSTRHDGACEKAAEAFQQLCEMLLVRHVGSAELSALPASWLEQLLLVATEAATPGRSEPSIALSPSTTPSVQYRHQQTPPPPYEPHRAHR